MKKQWTIPTIITFFIIIFAIIGIWHIKKTFQLFEGSGFSSLAPIVHNEALEVAGLFINESQVDLKEIIRKNQPKVVQIEREDGQVGSGFLYNDKGDIITNAHIVAGATTVLVRMPDTQTYYGTVIGVGEVIDVAVVRVKELKNLEPMKLSFEYEAEVGDPVIAMGSPRGYQNTVTTGIISAINRDFALPPYQFEKAYQISAPIAPGSSGGPLLSATTGKVIGINSAEYQGEVIGFSIPINHIWSLVTAWSEGEVPEEPISYYRMLLSEKEAIYLVHYFYESISNYDFVTAYALLGSEEQKKVSYEEFRTSYQTILSVEISNSKATIIDDSVQIELEKQVFEFKNGQFIEKVVMVTHEVGIENDKLKIITR